MSMKWYTIHVHSSMEKNVKKTLEERIQRSNLAECFGEVLLPIERVQESRNGRKITTERRMYPGYVFIEMAMNDDSWHLVNSTPRVLGFLGGTNPVELSDAEIAQIRAFVGESQGKVRPRTEFTIGEQIRITDGPFKDFDGRVDAIDYEKSRLKVMVNVFSRDTEVELHFSEVEKI